MNRHSLKNIVVSAIFFGLLAYSVPLFADTVQITYNVGGSNITLSIDGETITKTSANAADPEVISIKDNPEAAKALLAEAAYRILKGNVTVTTVKDDSGYDLAAVTKLISDAANTSAAAKAVNALIPDTTNKIIYIKAREKQDSERPTPPPAPPKPVGSSGSERPTPPPPPQPPVTSNDVL